MLLKLSVAVLVVAAIAAIAWDVYRCASDTVHRSIAVFAQRVA